MTGNGSRFRCMAVVLAAIFRVATPAPAAMIDSAGDPPRVSVQLWFVSFDRGFDAAKLPLDVRAIASDGRFPHMGPGPDRRIRTSGLARQMHLGKFSVEGSGHCLRFVDGALLTQPCGDGPRSGAPPWQVLSAPRLTVNGGQEATVDVGQPVAYLERRDDDCLVVRSAADAREGVFVRLAVQWVRDEGIRFRQIVLKASRIAGRQPVPGVPLDVGRPILDVRETELGLTLDPDSVAIMALSQGEDEPALLVFLTAQTEGAARRP